MMTKLQNIALAAAALMCATIITVVAVTRTKPAKDEQLPSMLSYDTEAVKGTPDTADQPQYYGTMEIPLTNGSCKLAMTAVPKLNGDKLDVYFTNSEDNTVGLKLVIYDEADNIIGQSGIIKNGEYVKSVKLKGNTEAGQILSAKILTYEADTYYSLGSARATLKVI